MTGLSEKLRATKPVELSYFTNRTSPLQTAVTHSLVNPDGPEAADLTIRARASLEVDQPTKRK